MIKSIIPARNKNYLWLGTNREFSYYNSRTRSLEFTVNTKDGLSGDEITPGGLFLDNNDLLWVAPTMGYPISTSGKVLPVLRSGVLHQKMFLNGEPKTPQNGRLLPQRKQPGFEISALSFADEASVEYEYYLRGTGNKYSAYSRGKEYRAQYTNLPPGKYEFIYRAKGKNNIWGYAEKYEFSIRKAWYNTWVFRLTVVFSFVLLTYLSYLVRIRTIKAQRNRLEQQVRERTHELEVANTEIEAQRDFARSQRDHIAQQQKAIVDSIQYAETIQSSLLPPPAQLEKHVSEYMVLFKPRDIVSGDFYWISEQDGAVYVAAADCTGHGVPGAFMSMLGMALMNEIVNKQNHIEPGELLNELRSRIMQTLHQRADPDSAKDGMDMVLCRYEPQNGRLQFAGANNPLYFVRDGELTEYKNDKMPVSIYEVMHPFLTREIKVRKGDSVYFFSDGYADQFGGPKGKKFKYRELKNLFLKHHKKPMGEQRQILDKTFERWKGNLEQIDDVVVVGLRF
ncbi:MAG: SpoIIE family protein phosphatase [Bacteroidales bacterium]